MDAAGYWALVERARSGAADADETAGRLVDLLAELPPAEIVAADVAYRAIVRPGYTWSLWGAAYVINGGCGDDGFDYFRAWLVAQGRDVFERALAEPDSLAAVVTAGDADEAFCEDLLGAPWLAHQKVTGHGLPPGGPYEPPPDLGEGWDFDDDAEMRARYPRLTAVFFDGA